MDNYFLTLNKIDVSGKTEKKQNLTYLSWAWAWAELKKLFPAAYYTIYENNDGLFYHTDGRTAWVKTGVTVEGIEHIEYLPVMDHRNKSIALDNITSFDVNKSIQRSLTKAVARHGLGLYIYAGEDLPEERDGKNEAPADNPLHIGRTPAPKCAECKKEIIPTPSKSGKMMTAQEVATGSEKKYGRKLCADCAKKASAKAKLEEPKPDNMDDFGNGPLPF